MESGDGGIVSSHTSRKTFLSPITRGPDPVVLD